MILKCNLNTDLEIENLEDFSKLKPLIDNGLKVNWSRISREHGCDRRTAKKYSNGYTKPTNRKRPTQFDEYYPTIKKLLNDSVKVFDYKSILWKYLVDNHSLKAPESSFRRYISSVEEFQQYFDKKKKSAVTEGPSIRFETEPGEQAQLDWKESMDMVLNTGEVITVNVFAIILGYSRFRFLKLTLSKTQDILLNHLDEAFAAFGGVPKRLLVDNMKTAMDDARTQYSGGKVNNRFQQFADDYGFTVAPCIAGRAKTKGKVEAPMKILNELKAYQGDLSYVGLHDKVVQINNRENHRYHEGYDGIPALLFQKEKDFLLKLPTNSVRKSYMITTTTVKVNASSMITYKRNQYSVPPKYVGLTLQLQAHDNHLHIYSNTSLVAMHEISTKRLNYLESNYIDIVKQTLNFHDDNKISEIAVNNLKMIGERYKP